MPLRLAAQYRDTKEHRPLDGSFLVFLALIAIAVFVLGPAGFFLALGARSRLDATQNLVRSLEARIGHLQLQLDRQAKVARPQQSEGEKPESGQAGAPDAAGQAARADADESVVQRSAPDAAARRQDEPAAAPPTPEGPTAPLPEPPLRRSTVPPAGATSRESVTGDAGLPPPPSAATPRGPGLEERLGTRWTVWIGGLALALGALLLVRYAIEQGWFGPGMRVLMGLALALVLIGAGEKLRRQEKAAQPATGGPPEPSADSGYDLVPDLSRPSIPAILTAAGTVAAFGSIYAAHALYGFVEPAFAFVALGIVAVATMVAAGLHGPMLAGIGLAASLGVPLLVSSANPSPWPVVLYLAAIAVASYGLARMRRWLWLALAAAIGAGLWTLLFLEPVRSAIGVEFYQAALIHLVLQGGMALYVLVYEPYRDDPDGGPIIDPLPSLVAFGLAGVALFALATATAREFGTLWFVGAAAIAGMLAAAGFLRLRACLAMTAAGVLAVLSLLVWPAADGLPGGAGYLHGSGWRDGWYDFLPPLRAGAYGGFGLLVALGIGATALWRVLRGANLSLLHVIVFAGTATLTPLLGLIAAYLRIANGAVSTTFGALAAGLGVLFAIAAHVFRNGVRDHKPMAWDIALGICASAAIAAIALGFTLLLDGGTLTIALALAALGAAFVAVRLDIPLLQWCVAGLAAVLAARFVWEPNIVRDIGPTPVFNWLLAGYGIPALSFAISAWLMRRTYGESRPVQIAQAAAILFAALLVHLQVHHFALHGQQVARLGMLAEAGLHAISSLGFALVLLHISGRDNAVIFRWASYIFGIMSGLFCVTVLGLAVNPFFSCRGVQLHGGIVFNPLMLAYLIPGGLALLLGRMAEGIRPPWYVMGARIVAMGPVFLYLTLQVRRIFQGPDISYLHRTSDGEWYAYSAVWLAFGVVLLAYGLWRKSVEVRIASALFIVLSVIKVFLFDMAGLDGFLRALSFIGLGAVLIGIGLVYQKWVFARPLAGPADEAAKP